MYAELPLRHSFLKLGLCLLMSCLPLVVMAQMPFVTQQEALAQLESQLQIGEGQSSAFHEAMEDVYALREEFRLQITQAAGGQGVDLQALKTLSEALQARSEEVLRTVLNKQQLEAYRDINAIKAL
jgi:hypothetical protein